MSNKANKTIETLHLYESRNVTFIDPDGSWPIVWERAKGMRVWDDAGREYLDLPPRLVWLRPGTPTRESLPPGSGRWPGCCTRWATFTRTRSRPS